MSLDDCDLPEVREYVRSTEYAHKHALPAVGAGVADAALTALYERVKELEAERDLAIDMYAPAREREQTLALLRSTLEAHHE